ncbi:MAG: hypothetical protein Q8880_12265 [Bacteroidota bacterium]|nr:hypothetical protein [Bacteroidota bacterium]
MSVKKELIGTTVYAIYEGDICKFNIEGVKENGKYIGNRIDPLTNNLTGYLCEIYESSFGSDPDEAYDKARKYIVEKYERKLLRLEQSKEELKSIIALSSNYKRINK